ncbi:hypothetical protein D0B54_19255 [Solimonas sp. K1W22B-7]|nr:hypothetical protein D0B54_19255 [Solimonas sp. K1W22B-7]
MVVMSNPVEGREAEYNDWYQNVHLAEVVALPGFRSAQRFRLARSLTERETWPYAAIYEIETEDIDAVLQQLRDAAGSGGLTMSESLATSRAYATIYEEHGSAVTK